MIFTIHTTLMIHDFVINYHYYMSHELIGKSKVMTKIQLIYIND